MQFDQALADIRERVAHPRITNLIYLRLPVIYTPIDPARQVAQALDVEPVSVMGLLVERFGDRWDRLIKAEENSQLGTVSKALAQDLVDRAQSAFCVVICDTEVLYAFPDLNPTALLYPHSGERVIVVSVKASRVAGGLRLLEDGPVYPVDNCTVLDVALNNR